MMFLFLGLGILERRKEIDLYLYFLHKVYLRRRRGKKLVAGGAKVGSDW
jgi:hypothetical protein